MPDRPRKPAAKSKAPKRARIAVSSDMRIAEITALLPGAEVILLRYGLHCAGCSMGGEETLAEGYRGHGYPDEELPDLVAELNGMLRERPERPLRIGVTEAAARALGEILAREGRGGAVLEVAVDDRGGFCLEFHEAAATGDPVFGHPAVPEVRITATPLTLGRVGGATVDFREGRFKLDLPEDGKKCCGGGNEECGCAQ